MIRDVKLWQQWEDDYLRSTPLTLEQKLALLEAMYQEARALGVFPLADPLEGLEVKIHLARVINVSTPPGKDRAGS